MSRVNFQDFKDNTTLISKLDQVKNYKSKGKNGKIIYSEFYNFFLETDYATYIENDDGSYHSYTFPIIRAEDNGLLENLFLSLQEDGSYSASIISYNFSKEEFDNFKVGKYVDLTNKVSQVSLEYNNIFAKADNNCFWIEHTWCWKGNHESGYEDDGSKCPAHGSNPAIFECFYGSSGSSGGGSDPGSGSSPNSGNTGSGANGGGASGSGSIGNDSGLEVTAPIICKTCPSLKDALAKELTSLLEDDPFALIDVDCEELSKKWAGLAKHRPNQSVLNRIENLNRNGYDIEVQYINEASGPVVNMDYFPVEISKLPINPETGLTYSGDEFFNYIRKNFSDICFSDNTSFSAYNFVESQKWNNSKYLGAVMRFDITVFSNIMWNISLKIGQQDGSVICTNQQDQSWIFTTIYSFQDNSHPVSGNREFGMKSNPDGSFTFYTSGVDRVAEHTDNILGQLPGMVSAFEGGEQIWSSLQDNLMNFINDPTNGGKASTSRPSIKRIDIELLEEVLKGDKKVHELGCN